MEALFYIFMWLSELPIPGSEFMKLPDKTEKIELIAKAKEEFW